MIDAAFRMLRLSDARDDYVYRTAVIERILLGRHSLNTASSLSEFRVGRSKADLVIVNGTSTAYEIKSDRDSLVRLPNQVDEYRKHFSRVVVVASEHHVKQIERMVPSDVGILTLTRKLTLRTVREAIAKPELIDPVSLISSIRLSEAESVIRQLKEEVPAVPNATFRKALNMQVESKDPVEVHNAVFRVLRRSRSQAALTCFVESLPSSLHSIALARNPSIEGQKHVKSALSASFGEALTWR